MGMVGPPLNGFHQQLTALAITGQMSVWPRAIPCVWPLLQIPLSILIAIATQRLWPMLLLMLGFGSTLFPGICPVHAHLALIHVYLALIGDKPASVAPAGMDNGSSDTHSRNPSEGQEQVGPMSRPTELAWI